MIGKMYRPLKILNIPGKRGFNILNKYKSNFGGTFKFETNLYLNYNFKEKTEVVQIECKNLNIPIYIEEGTLLSENKLITSTEERNILSLRKLIRPTKISSKDKLEFEMSIESGKEESENDTLIMTFVPILIDDEEYMKVTISCETPVIFHSDTAIILTK